jgi:hypothetical protein
MKVVIEIECDNAAFEDDPGLEVAKILLGLVNHLRNCRVVIDGPGPVMKLRDSNGNTVGSCKAVGH